MRDLLFGFIFAPVSSVHANSQIDSINTNFL